MEKRALFNLLTMIAVLTVFMLATACVQQLDEEKALQEDQAGSAPERETITEPSVPETAPATPQKETSPVTAPAEPEDIEEETATEPVSVPNSADEEIAPEADLTAIGDSEGERQAAEMVDEYLTKRSKGEIDDLYTYYVFDNGGYTQTNPQVEKGIINRIKGSDGAYQITEYEILSSARMSDQDFVGYYTQYSFDRFGKFFLGKDLYLVRVRVTTDPIDIAEKLNKGIDDEQIGISHFFVVKVGDSYKLIYTDTQISMHQVV